MSSGLSFDLEAGYNDDPAYQQLREQVSKEVMALVTTTHTFERYVKSSKPITTDYITSMTKLSTKIDNSLETTAVKVNKLMGYRISDSRRESFRSSFIAAKDTFAKAQQLWVAKCQERSTIVQEERDNLERTSNIANGNGTNGFFGQDQITGQLAPSVEVDRQTAWVTERGEATTRILDRVEELAEMQAALAGIVASHQEGVDRISNNINMVTDTNQGAARELTSAQRSQKSWAKWKCYLLMLLVIVLSIIVLAVLA